MARKSRKKNTAAEPGKSIWKAAVYARLSLEDSGRKGADTIKTQVELVESYIAQQEYLLLIDTYIDNGASGKSFSRPAWNRLANDIRTGHINCICVKDLSRFSRNYIETIEFIEKIFPLMGVRFISVNDGYDSENPGANDKGLMIALKSLLHDQYLKDISRKTTAAHLARRARGEFTGAFAPFGYKKSKTIKGRLEPDEVTASFVRDIFKWRAEGMSRIAICKRLDAADVLCPSAYLKETTNGNCYYRANIWQPGAIKKMIANPVYIGHLAYGKTRRSLAEHIAFTSLPSSEWYIVENTHEPIVSNNLWKAANAIDASCNAKFYEHQQNKALTENLFRGYLVCGFCGARLMRSHNTRANPSGKRYEYFYYYCPLHQTHSDEQDYKPVRFEVIYDMLLTFAKQISMLNQDLLKADNDSQKPVELSQKILAQLIDRIEIWGSDYFKLVLNPFPDKLEKEK